MDVFLILLKWLHLGSLLLALGVGAALSLIAISAARAASGREPQWAIYARLEPLVMGGVVVLLTSGLLLLWLKYNFAVSHWLWVKMALLATLTVAVMFEFRSVAGAKAGDAIATRTMTRAAAVGIGLDFLIVLAAVLAFN